MRPDSIQTSFDVKLFKYQLRYGYLFAPTIIYFVLLIFYPVIQVLIFDRINLNCLNKALVINVDETIFSWFYDYIDTSFNVGLLVILAIPYLLHFINPVLYIAFLIYKRAGYNAFWRFVLSFGLTCSLGICIQSMFPTAPPWYYLKLPNQAKFHLVDELFNFKVFHTLYGLNKLICGAFPSLHVGWPTVIAMNGVVHPYFGVSYVTLIATAAIYSRHHWILDVVFGFLIAFSMCLLGARIVEWLRIPQIREEALVQEKLPDKNQMEQRHGNDLEYP